MAQAEALMDGFAADPRSSNVSTLILRDRIKKLL
jgi:hypothetical protein